MMNASDIPFIMLGVVIGIFACVRFYFFTPASLPWRAALSLNNNNYKPDKIGVEIPKVENRKNKNKIIQNNILTCKRMIPVVRQIASNIDKELTHW